LVEGAERSSEDWVLKLFKVSPQLKVREDRKAGNNKQF